MQGIMLYMLYGYARNMEMRGKKAILIGAWLFIGPALAQPEQGISVYPASFFADARPATAYDMVGRLPGFSLDTGAGTSVRGFAGNAGNVLVDGTRPTAKNDDLQSILQRIPASNVERIELIRGSAPGIDMQGQSVVANVVRKKRILARSSSTPISLSRERGSGRLMAASSITAKAVPTAMKPRSRA